MKYYKYRQVQTTVEAAVGDKIVDELNRMGSSGFRVIDVTKHGSIVVYLLERAE